MKKILTNLFFVPCLLLLGATKPEHSLYNAVFWLLVLLCVLIATLALKIACGVVDKRIELWRACRKNRQGTRRPKDKKDHSV